MGYRIYSQLFEMEKRHWWFRGASQRGRQQMERTDYGLTLRWLNGVVCRRCD